MKLVSHYFESVSGIEIYPIISFLIFFFFFLVVGLMVIRMDKNDIEELSNLPLDDDPGSSLPEQKS